MILRLPRARLVRSLLGDDRSDNKGALGRLEMVRGMDYRYAVASYSTNLFGDEDARLWENKDSFDKVGPGIGEKSRFQHSVYESGRETVGAHIISMVSSIDYPTLIIIDGSLNYQMEGLRA